MHHGKRMLRQVCTSIVTYTFAVSMASVSVAQIDGESHVIDGASLTWARHHVALPEMSCTTSAHRFSFYGALNTEDQARLSLGTMSENYLTGLACN